VPQDDSKASYAHKLSKADGLINWELDAVQIERQIRAYNPWPVCQFNFEDKMVRVWSAELVKENNDNATSLKAGTVVAVSKQGIEVATGKGILKLTSLQFPGKKTLTVAQILQGNAGLFKIGTPLF
jgi:methionyl-tRNA formyltransferase